MLAVAAKQFRQHGVVTAILSTGERPGIYADLMRAEGCEVHHLPFAKTPAFFRSLYRFLQATRPNAVFIHTERAYFWYGLTARLAGVRKIVRFIHNVFVHHPWRRTVQNHILQWLGVTLVSGSQSVLHNEWTRCHTRTQMVPYWYDSQRIIPPTPEQRLASRRELNVKEGDFVILVIGNCSPVKNHTALLRAMALLPAETLAVLLHVGLEEEDGPERKLAAQLGLLERIRFLGFVNDLLPLLWAADGYVMPSLFEGFPISTLAALGTGLPVVLAATPGLLDFKEYIADLQWCDPNRPETISAGLQAVRHISDETRLALRQKMHAAVAETFGLEQGVRTYVRLASDS